MSPVAQASILAAKLLAHHIESASMQDIKDGLTLLRIHSAVNACKEQRYTQYGFTHVSNTVEHPGFVAMSWAERDEEGVMHKRRTHYVRADISSVLEDIEQVTERLSGTAYWSMLPPSKVAEVNAINATLMREEAHAIYA